MSTPNIEDLVSWSKPQPFRTKHGPKLLRIGAPTHRFWQAWANCKQALKKAGISLRPTASGWQACWWQPDTTTEIPSHVTLSDIELSRLERVRDKLLPYQIDAAKRLALAAKRLNGALDASDTGTGKTYTALAACIMLNRPVYVVCPKSVIPVWHRAAQHLGMRAVAVTNYEQAKLGHDHAVTLVHDDRPGRHDRYQWTLMSETIIIFDECHRLKGQTQNQQLGLAAIEQGYTVLGLSATAAENPLGMKFVGTLLKLFPRQQFWRWALQHGVYHGRYGYTFGGDPKYLAQIHQAVFPDRGVRIRIADLGDMFPPTQIQAEPYAVNGKAAEINRIYTEMHAEIERLRKRAAQDSHASILTAQLRARQQVELLKVPAIVEMVDDAVATGLSVAVFVNFDASIDAILDRLNTTCCIRGGQTLEARQACIDSFQSDRQKTIVCNIKAGGLGVSLHGSPTSRMRMSIISPTYSAIDLVQALGRVHRAGGAKSIQRIFFAAETVEEQICRNVRSKLANLHTLNDGDLAPENLF